MKFLTKFYIVTFVLTFNFVQAQDFYDDECGYDCPSEPCGGVECDGPGSQVKTPVDDYQVILFGFALTLGVGYVVNKKRNQKVA
ncbi:hypothetical protein ACF3NR_04030 [Vaginella massiliensis]|uniref:hypothetical protein n=1 Tax=Vaginella massiliensis TaxID=1816680 RepID=UPI000839524E|nr:hypothetical protein [Vaginella massiliensis]